jgi:exoribonuclease R
MHKVLHGDRAVARVSGLDRRGRREGEIVEVLTRANREVVGRLHEERGVHFIVAENRRINQDFLVPPDGVGKAKVGEIVVAEIVEQPTGNREAVARVTEVLGNATDPGIEIEIALRKHALPFEFGKEAARQAKRLPAEVRPPTARIARTSRACRWSRSTARPRRTSTTPSIARRRAQLPARRRDRRRRALRARRRRASTRTRASAARRCTSRAA